MTGGESEWGRGRGREGGGEGERDGRRGRESLFPHLKAVTK